MTRPSLRNLVPTSLIVFGALACTVAGAPRSVAASADTLPTSTAYSPSRPYSLPPAAALSSRALGRSSSPAATADSSERSDADMPDAPEPQTGGDGGGKQTKRILGIIPNFRAVSANTKLPPMSIKDKFVTASEDSLDYSAVFIPAAVAGYNMARNSTPEFGH